jgi:flavin reductase (DIM6/NTAB) family NADH-FMN oxidoreductase RutF
MGRFATGVTVVTTRHDEEVSGMTANAVVSLSLDPPLILVCVDLKGTMHGMLKAGRCFAVNVLRADQQEFSTRFAKPGPKDFSGIELTEARTGAPIMAGALAYADCEVVDIVGGGDHDMFIGQMLAGETHEGAPLIFYGGRYANLEANENQGS